MLDGVIEVKQIRVTDEGVQLMLPDGEIIGIPKGSQYSPEIKIL